MAHYCCSCGNLDPKKNKAGKVNGNLYFCKKKKSFVNPTSTDCGKFEKAYKRKNYEIDEIYREGKIYDNDDTPMGLYVLILIVLIILAIIFKIFNLY